MLEFDENGNIVKEFPTVSAVVSELNCNPTSFSGYLHRDSQLKFQNRIFKFKNPPQIKHISEWHKQQLLKTRATRAVIKLSKDLQVLEVFNSINEAAASIEVRP